MSKSILVVAGETSGDILGSAVLKQWKKSGAKKISFWGFGGSELKNAGVEIIKDIEDLSVIGFLEAILNYRRLSSYLDNLVLEAIKRNISCAILIDYPGFNLKLAEKLHENGIPVYLVVSPQLWAWHYNRIFKIKKYIKCVLCLYKFEMEMYKENDIPAVFIGHPIMQKIELFIQKHKSDIAKIKKRNRDIRKVALLPGSRWSEIRRHMPFIIETAGRFREKYPDTTFEIPSASETISELLKEYQLPDYISIRDKNTYLTMATADSAIVCSGTATLECAIFNLPFLLIYKTSWATYFLGKKLIRIPFIGIVNVLCKSFVTKEFIQSDMRLNLVLPELEKINFDPDYIRIMKKNFTKVKKEIYTKDPAMAAAKFFSKIIK